MPDERTARELEHARAVREMFSGIARKYDFLNHFLSVNIDRRWRRKVSEKLKGVLENPQAIVLDVACGTGDLSLELKNAGKAKVIGADFCRPMLIIAKDKTEKLNGQIPYVEGDGMNLSFADETFDAVTIAFGLRNFSNWQDGLRELHRVLKKGGRIAILEFSAPVVPGFRRVFNFYFSHVLPRIGGAVSGSRGAYQYLPDSVSRFPDQKNLAKMMREIGFFNVEYKNLTGGIAAIHSGVKKMSVSINVSEETYNKLKASAQVRGKENVEQLLEDWEDEQAVEWQKELTRRKEVGKRIKELRERIFQEHGVMPDSTELVREDRNR